VLVAVLYTGGLVAPLVGGLLQTALGYTALFTGVASCMAFTCLLCCAMPESLAEENRNTQIRPWDATVLGILALLFLTPEQRVGGDCADSGISIGNDNGSGTGNNDSADFPDAAVEPVTSGGKRALVGGGGSSGGSSSGSSGGSSSSGSSGTRSEPAPAAQASSRAGAGGSFVRSADSTVQAAAQPCAQRLSARDWRYARTQRGQQR
jgi:uncharacterized membrane protein YgcG